MINVGQDLLNQHQMINFNARYIKNFIRTMCRSFGIEITRYAPDTNPTLQVRAALDHAKVNIVFDIGANDGGFGKELRSVGFCGKIVSFEPLTKAHRKLSISSEKDSKWLIHSRVAIGDHNGEIEINVARNSVSSSILPMLDAHSNAAVDSVYVSRERASLATLDSLASQYLCSESRPFIKIDTQGYEWQVLDGAVETIKIAEGLLIELSLTPLYKGQRLWLEIIERLSKENFSLWAIQKGFSDPRNGRLLQVDAVFMRRGGTRKSSVLSDL